MAHWSTNKKEIPQTVHLYFPGIKHRFSQYYMKLQRQISKVIPQEAITNAKRGKVNGFVRLGLSRTIIYV